jgi:hypothetical protein
MIDVAHELRTPLTNIRGYLEALNDGVLPPDPATLSLLQDETLRLVQLVEDVLALARADAAGSQLQWTTVDLKAMVENTVATFTPALLKRSLTTRLDVSASPATLHADRDRLARVLRNLTDNAVQYAPQGSVVDIAIEADAKGFGWTMPMSPATSCLTICPISSNGFIAGRNHDPATMAAPASACPSSRNWWRPMAERCMPKSPTASFTSVSAFRYPQTVRPLEHPNEYPSFFTMINLFFSVCPRIGLVGGRMVSRGDGCAKYHLIRCSR